jgi:hypothetical protein
MFENILQDKFAAGVNDAGGKLPPVSTTPAATPWQLMGTISGCRLHKVNLKAEIYIYVNSTTQRCPNKIIKIFQLEDFFHLPPVSLSREYLREFSNRIEMAVMVYSDAWGKLIHEKNQKSKIS